MKANFLTKIMELFKPRPRKLGIGRGKMKLEWVGDGKVTPEELFDEDDDIIDILRNISDKNVNQLARMGGLK